VRHVRMLGVCVVAAFAVAAVAAACASAAKLPEWGKCEATAGNTGGMYADAGCTVPVKKVNGGYLGGYEWTSNLSHHQTPELVGSNGRGATTGSWTFETAAGTKIECSGLGRESETRLLAPKNQRTPLLEFEECKSAGAGGGECGTPDASIFGEEGDITNNPEWFEEEIEPGVIPGWASSLGFIAGKDTSTPTVGVTYGARNRGEKLFEPVVCKSNELGTVWIGGERKGGNSFISTISPVDQMSATYTQVSNESAPGVQSPERFQTGKQHVLQAFIHGHWEPLAITGHITYELEEPVEIKAIK
jgi:hypothetical protein